MKRIIALLTVVGLVGITAPAEAVVKIGVHGGISFSQNKLEPEPGSFSNQLGMIFGGSLAFDLGGGTLEGDILYQQFKFKMNPSGSGEVTGTATTITLPLLYRLELGPLSVGAGGFFAIPASDNTFVDDNGNETTQPHNSKAGFGLVAAAGISFPMGGFDLMFDARYYLGLNDVDKDAASENTLGAITGTAGLVIGI